MTITEMRQILAERNVQLTKSLGQNFLFDQNQLRKITQAAELTKTDQVLEIGPGLGPLTELLLQEAGEVLAIEKDARLVEILSDRLPDAQHPAKRQLTLLHADALEFLRETQRDWHGWKLVSNLPYSVASPILVELANSRQPPVRIVATLQIEAAKRLMAEADTPDYGILTLLLQLIYEPRGWFKIPASCFFPMPEVDSACVFLTRRDRPLLASEARDTFVQLVKQAFSQRRKMMFKLLKVNWPPRLLQRAFEQAEVSLEARAESVSLEKFVRLAIHLRADSRDARGDF